MQLTLPKESGTLRVPISLSRVSTGQRPIDIFNFIKKIIGKRNNIYIAIIYTDTLYLYNEGEGHKLKRKHENLMVAHKKGLEKLFKEIQSRVNISYTSRSQQYIQSVDIINDREKVYQTYKSDQIFQKLLSEDCEFSSGRKVTENQINFFIEENLITYYALHNFLSYNNVKNHRTLSCYSGPMLKHQAYMYINNITSLELSINPFGFHQYDPVSDILYNAKEIELSSYKYNQ